MLGRGEIGQGRAPASSARCGRVQARPDAGRSELHQIQASSSMCGRSEPVQMRAWASSGRGGAGELGQVHAEASSERAAPGTARAGGSELAAGGAGSG
jgi:hypothetical protein